MANIFQYESKEPVSGTKINCPMRPLRPTISHVNLYVKTITISNQDAPLPSPFLLDITSPAWNTQSLMPKRYPLSVPQGGVPIHVTLTVDILSFPRGFTSHDLGQNLGS